MQKLEKKITDISPLIGRTQLLFATGIERGIHDHQVLKYQPSVTSRVIFHHLIPLVTIEYRSISLDVTYGWYFRTWQSWMPPSMPVALSKWVGLLTHSKQETTLSHCMSKMGDTSRRCDAHIEPSDLQFQGSTNLISHQPNDLGWAGWLSL